MKTKNLLFICAILASGILVSCGGGKKKSSGGNSDASVSDSVKFVQIADADTFLESWSKDNVLIFHFIGEPDDMHPSNGNAESRTFINNYTQRYLVASDLANLKLRADLVKALPEISADELEFTYELRDEPTWDNGDKLTMEDVIFTFKANKCPLTNNPHAKPYLENLKDIIVDPTNPRKFKMVMKKQYIQNITFLTDYGVMQRTVFDPNNTLAKYTFEQFDSPEFNTNDKKDLNAWATEFNNPKNSRIPKNLVGMGAYQFADWKPMQSITLVKKPNHWTAQIENPGRFETAYPEKIIFKINTDANSQLLEFKTQIMDASTYLTTKSMQDLLEDQNFVNNYNAKFTDTYNYTYMAFNTKPDGVKNKKLFTDKNVRRALALITPVDDINAVINRGKNTRMSGPVSPLKQEYNRDLPLLPYDLEKAKQMLDEAGWKDTDGNNIRDKEIDGVKVQFEFDLNFLTTTVAWKDMAQMIAESYYKAGVKVNLKPLDFAVLYDNGKNHNFDVMLAGWAGSSSPEDFTQIWHTASWASKGSNYPGFGNAETDALIDSIKYTLDDSKRHPMVKRLQAVIYEEQPYVFFYSNNRRTVVHKRFGNCEMYFERPGVALNNLKLLSGATAKPTASAQ